MAAELEQLKLSSILSSSLPRRRSNNGQQYQYQPLDQISFYESQNIKNSGIRLNQQNEGKKVNLNPLLLPSLSPDKKYVKFKKPDFLSSINPNKKVKDLTTNFVQSPKAMPNYKLNSRYIQHASFSIQDFSNQEITKTKDIDKYQSFQQNQFPNTADLMNKAKNSQSQRRRQSDLNLSGEQYEMKDYLKRLVNLEGVVDMINSVHNPQREKLSEFLNYTSRDKNQTYLNPLLARKQGQFKQNFFSQKQSLENTMRVNSFDRKSNESLSIMQESTPVNIQLVDELKKTKFEKYYSKRNEINQ
eukprot:403342918